MAASPEVTPTSPVPNATTSALPRRRNGKPQSCEPCRLSKAACDHTLPICSRCVRRGIGDRCTYHPAPMTKVQGPAKVIRRSEQIRKGPQSATGAASNILCLLAQQHSPSGGSEGSSNSQTQRAEVQYLGSTNYSAVFQENKDSMGPEAWVEPQNDPDREDSNRMKEALHALRTIPDQSICEMLLDVSFEIYNSPLHEPATRFCLQSLWDTYGDVLRDRDSEPQLRKMALDLLRNTDAPTVTPRDSAEWLESHTGKNICFEMIGTLLALLALAIPALPDRHSLFRTLGICARDYVYKLGIAAESCQSICNDLAVVNEFTLYLNYHTQILQGIYRGDDHGFFWRKSGHAATTITALGLHRESTVTKSAPFMVAELRKRMFTASFIVDKQLATLFGRPPRLSRRYSNCSLPLDLDDEELMLQGADLSAKLAKLDAVGWNTEGKVNLGGCMRGVMIALRIRDEILELSLGPDSDCTPQRRDEVKAKSAAAFSSLPPQYQYDFERDIDTLTPAQLGSIITLKLEFLLNEYLLDRLPTTTTSSADPPANKQPLIATALQILHTILTFFGRGDCAGGLFVCSSRLSVYFGIPAAGVLAVELLKAHQFPRRYTLALPRAQVIRDLSVFNHYLGTVSNCNGNFLICRRIWGVLGRVLDQVLSTEPGQAGAGAGGEVVGVGVNGTPEGDGGEVGEMGEEREREREVDGGGLEGGYAYLPETAGVPDMMGMGRGEEGMGDLEFMEWMSGVDWSKGPWTESF